MDFTNNNNDYDCEFGAFRKSIQDNTNHDRFMYLTISVDSCDDDLKNKYRLAADAHNKKIVDAPKFYDSGFDLFLPKTTEQSQTKDGHRYFSGANSSNPVNKVDFNIKCCARMFFVRNENVDNSYCYYTGFYTYARSSMSKTPLRLANNQGIIDSGYRGSLIGMFDCICDYYFMDEYSRMLQICAPNLVPIFVKIVDSVEELGPVTSRGEGGFGSTGK